MATETTTARMAMAAITIRTSTGKSCHEPSAKLYRRPVRFNGAAQGSASLGRARLAGKGQARVRLFDDPDDLGRVVRDVEQGQFLRADLGFGEHGRLQPVEHA